MPSRPSQLRSFDVRKDLDAVANLVETCFADTLDEDGRRYVNHMHAASRNPGYLRWAMAVAENTPMPFSGFVWEENGYLAIGAMTRESALEESELVQQRYPLLADTAAGRQARSVASEGGLG